MTKKSGTILQNKPRHPEGVSLKDALAEDDARKREVERFGIDKRATLVKAVDGGGDADAGTGATMRPNDEQLARINQFTRRPVTADEVVAFPTLSCNDLVDRDDDQFSTQCVKDFAALEQPFSPTGKSYMVNHDYKIENAVGRIFGTGTKKQNGVQWLTNEVYIPNTQKNQGFIEDLDFGINWAVSVGVTLGKSSCTVCGSAFSSWGYWCKKGHDKGLFYDPNSDEKDAWGYPLAVDPKTNKNAVKCVRVFDDPRDMYELSQVFLGAQYFAALEKQPDFAAVVKSATAEVPIIGLSAKEAEVIQFPKEPEKVSAARKLYEIKTEEDGSLSWIDGEGLRWNFDPESPEDGVTSLGRAANDDDQEGGEEDGEREVSSSEGSDGEGNVDGSGDSDGNEGEGVEGDQGDAGSDEQGSESSEASVDDPDDEDSEDSDENDESESDDEDDTNDDEESEEEMSKQAVLDLLSKSGLPNSISEAVQAAKDGESVATLLVAAQQEISRLSDENKSLTEKANLGDQFLKELRAEAIDAYVKNHQVDGQEKVNCDTFERLLDKCGDDVELIKALCEREMEEARKKFPKAVRRSSFPVDPNVSGDESTGTDSSTQKSASRIHG